MAARVSDRGKPETDLGEEAGRREAAAFFARETS
jgi:hypothetical protein